MQFLCDVHISYKIVHYFRSSGFEATHVNEILDKWHTKDGDICTYADDNDLIVLTKDADFRNSFLISNTPKKLVKINLGKMSTSVLSSRLKFLRYFPGFIPQWRLPGSPSYYAGDAGTSPARIYRSTYE